MEGRELCSECRQEEGRRGWDRANLEGFPPGSVNRIKETTWEEDRQELLSEDQPPGDLAGSHQQGTHSTAWLWGCGTPAWPQALFAAVPLSEPRVPAPEGLPPLHLCKPDEGVSPPYLWEIWSQAPPWMFENTESTKPCT